MAAHHPSAPHREPGRYERSWTLHEQRDSVERLQGEVAEALAAHGFGEAAAFAIRLALEEALVNGFRHGNRGDPDKHVTVECAIDPSEVCLEVIDQGEGFDPGSVPDPTAEENIEIPSGRGIMLMRAYMTSVDYLPPGNRLRIVYRKDAQG